MPLSAHAALYIVLILITAVTRPLIGRLDRIVVAPGKVATRMPMLAMQPFQLPHHRD
jgi:HlyD family secretion protein